MVKKTIKEDKDFETPEDLDEFMSEEPDEFEDDEFMDDEEEAAPPPSKRGKVDIPPLPEEEEKEEDMLDIAADVPVQVVAVMGKKNITLKELAALRMGEVIELNRPVGEIVDLVAGGKLIAKGELVEIEGKLGVKIVKMIK